MGRSEYQGAHTRTRLFLWVTNRVHARIHFYRFLPYPLWMNLRVPTEDGSNCHPYILF